MSVRIYDLHVGDVFFVYGCGFSTDETFRVDSILMDVAVCRQETSGCTLILPLKVAMPFAVRIFSASVPPKPAPCEPSPVLPQHPADEDGKTEGQEPDLPEVCEPERIISTIDYYRPLENWGKIHVNGMTQGLFFHITQVEDDDLRAYLARLPENTRIPALKISYIKCRNPRHHDTVCAGSVRMEEKLPEPSEAVPEEETDHAGFLSEQETNGALLLIENDRTYRTKFSTAIDPALKAYLKNYASTGCLDSQNLQVQFVTSGNRVLRVVWSNQEKILEEQALSLDTLISPEELDLWKKRLEGVQE